MSTLARAVIRTYTVATHKADVQLADGLNALITGVPVATDIDAAEVVAGRECAVLFFTDDNPDDAVVITVHGAVPSADPYPQYPLSAGRDANDKLTLNNQASHLANIGGAVILHSLDDVLWVTGAPGGLGMSYMPGSQFTMMLGPGQSGWMFPTANTATPLTDYLGLFLGMTETSPTAAIVTLSSSGRLVTYQTAAAAGSVAGIATPDRICVRLAQFFNQTSFALPSVAGVRAFIGWTDQTLATMLGADQPAGLYFGLQFSTPRGDTTFRAVRQNATPTFTNTDTAVPADTAFHKLRFLAFAAAAILRMYTANGSAAQGNSILLSAPPVNSTILRFVAGVASQDGAVKGISFTDGQVTQLPV